MHYKFSDTELKKLLKDNFRILIDTREQVNQHVTEYFDSKKISYVVQKVDEGDYTAIITARPDMGIYRDLYFKVAVERKNSVDELAGNLSDKVESGTRDKTRLERELIKAKMKGVKMFLLIEDKNGFDNIRKGNYRSLYKSAAFIGKLTSIQDLYLNGTIFTDKKDSGFHIYRTLYYAVRNYLREGEFEVQSSEEGVMNG